MKRIVLSNEGARYSVHVGAILIGLVFIGAFGYISRIYFYHTIMLYVYGLFAVLLCTYFFKLHDRLSLPWPVVPIAAYMIWTSAVHDLSRSKDYLILFLTCTLILTIRLSMRSMEKLFKCISVAGTIFSLSIIWQRITPGIYYKFYRLIATSMSLERAKAYVASERAFTGFVGESAWACLCVATAISCTFVSLFFYKSSKRNLSLKIFMLGIMYVSIILTNRRAFILSVPAVLGAIWIYFMLRDKENKKKLIALAIIMLGLVMMYFVFLPIIMKILTQGGKGIQLSKREIYWDLAFKIFRKDPLFGQGPRSFDFYYIAMTQRDLQFAGAHNCYIQMLAEFGIVGTVMYVFFIVFMGVKSLRIAVTCLRENKTEIGFFAFTALVMQAFYVMMALSESAFFLPQALIMYFMFINVIQNCSVMSDKAERRKSHSLDELIFYPRVRSFLGRFRITR
ncbi:MAG: O-antigen ligase family protein [Ruminococcus sp.]|uniref:O-antigen ligase family protein n=1 Tax=Ruminococcus sp. TaxID=41978 RepID=UPI0025D6BCAD|nr:O-antigen ligase family protein [Ruminococcus sp.]MCR5601014.1 O-antigen ligase family protein [Ruminococcus sp.]